MRTNRAGQSVNVGDRFAGKSSVFSSLLPLAAEAVKGGIVGGLSGGPMGALAGAGSSLMGRLISGTGDYQVNNNSIIGADNVPMFSGPGQGSIRVKHREYIKDIISSPTPGAFNLETFF